MMNDLANHALDHAIKGADQAEIYVGITDSVDATIQNDQVDFAKEAYSLGMGIRVICDNKMGFAYTTQTEKITETVARAISNAQANQVDENFAFASKSDYPTVKGVFDKKISTLELEDTIELGKTMIDTVLENKCQPTSGGVSADCSKTLIINSDGVKCEDISTYFSGFIAVNVPDGEGVSTASESDSSRKLDIDPEKVASRACEVALNSRGGKTIETGDMKVLMDHHAAAGLLSTFSQAINGDNVQRGRSIYVDKINTEVLSPSLNIYDDGTIKGGLYSSHGDGEGTPSQKTTIIENGVLKNFLYDIHTAKKGNVDSTGNGMRASFNDMPAVSLSNFILDFKDFEELSEIKEGLLVTDVLGAHTANPISGDFSVEAMNAFKIEKGELAHPVKNAMLSGNIFSILKDSKAASEKTRQLGPFIVPPITVSSLRVVGQK
ncbi:MAG: putative Zn-dependent protease-like protein [Methanobacterium sp. Maddingley MBC34]|nr:MAG: putative Zn-dependent protease-like protein [Methanobacterium sp. Maddingley MBC34]